MSALHPHCQHTTDEGHACTTRALRWVAGTCGIHATDDEIDSYLRIDRSVSHHPSSV